MVKITPCTSVLWRTCQSPLPYELAPEEFSVAKGKDVSGLSALSGGVAACPREFTPLLLEKIASLSIRYLVSE